MMLKNMHSHLRSLELYTVGALAGLVIAFGTPEDTWAAEQQTAGIETQQYETSAGELDGSLPGELDGSLGETGADTEYREKGPGIGMAPEGFGSGGLWTSSASLMRILGPGEDSEHPRFYNVVNGKIVGIVVR